MTELASRKCVPCHGGVPRMKRTEIRRLLKQLRDWEAVDDSYLRKFYAFPNFRSALAFVKRISRVAEAEGHHPDITFGWGYAEIKIFTHAIGGLSESDFILAAKIDDLEG